MSDCTSDVSDTLPPSEIPYPLNSSLTILQTGKETQQLSRQVLQERLKSSPVYHTSENRR